MTAQELLSQLRAKGVDIKASDGRLVIDAPRGTITDELRSALAERKPELLQILSTEKDSVLPSVTETDAKVQTLWQPEPISAPVLEPAIQTQLPSAHKMSGAEEEIARLEAEMSHLRTEEEARRAEVEAERLAADNALRVEQERWREAEEEIARRRAEQERQRIDAEVRTRADEEKRREIADQEMVRAEEEIALMRAAEVARRKQVDDHLRAAQQTHEAQLLSLRQVEEEQARRRAEEERNYLENQARKRAQEEELRRRAESRFRAVEEEIELVQTREQARLKAEQEAQRLAEEAERRRAEEEARRKAEEHSRRRAEEEARLRAEIESQLRAEAAERRRAEEEFRRHAEEEARRRAEEEAQRLAAEHARRLAEEEAERRAEEEGRRAAEEAARMHAEEAARRHAEDQARLSAQLAEREREEGEARERADLEMRIRAEIEAKIRAEEEEATRAQAEEADRRRAEHERIVAEEAAKRDATGDYPFEIERGAHEPSKSGTAVKDITEWFDAEPAALSQSASEFGVAEGGEFHPVSIPEDAFDDSSSDLSAITNSLRSSNAGERATAVSELARVGGEGAFRRICGAFDDQSVEVRSTAARALFDFQQDRAASFTRALREATPERRRKIGAAIGASGLANEAIRNLTGESRDKTYDAFSLLFLMSKAGEVQPLMRAIEEHPSTEVRLAVIKLLALSGQPEVLPAFRRMAVRGSLPPEVRSAVMEGIYQITSQSPAEAN